LAARGTGDGKHAELADLHLRQDGRHRKEYEINVAGEDARHRFRAAFVRHVAHVDPRHTFQQFGSQMPGRSVTCR
jgi:DNA-binding PadR family transcriptional regulator